jgi:phosphomannomutase
LEKRYVGYDEIIFFDGDSDRIIIKMASNDQCFDGNYFLMLYIKTFVKIMKELKDSHVIDG